MEEEGKVERKRKGKCVGEALILIQFSNYLVIKVSLVTTVDQGSPFLLNTG